MTPISFQHMLLQVPNYGNHPVLLGPILIHQTKFLRPFHYFASTLTRLNPNLIDIKCIGTDGEPELIKMVFSKAVHLRCTNHVRRTSRTN